MTSSTRAASIASGARHRTGPDRRAPAHGRASRVCAVAVRRAVPDLFDSRGARAVRTAEVLPARFHALPDDRHLAVKAAWRERVDRALEAVEDVDSSSDRDLEGLVVLVAAALALLHAPARLQGEVRNGSCCLVDHE